MQEVSYRTLPGLVAWLITRMSGVEELTGLKEVSGSKAGERSETLPTDSGVETRENGVGSILATAATVPVDVAADKDLRDFLDWCQSEEALGEIIFTRK